jgi:hypothetical protein
MWKSLGVIGVWLVLIAAPHLGTSARQMSVSGISVGPTVPETAPADDPGDP